MSPTRPACAPSGAWTTPSPCARPSRPSSTPRRTPTPGRRSTARAFTRSRCMPSLRLKPKKRPARCSSMRRSIPVFSVTRLPWAIRVIPRARNSTRITFRTRPISPARNTPRQWARYRWTRRLRLASLRTRSGMATSAWPTVRKATTSWSVTSSPSTNNGQRFWVWPTRRSKPTPTSSFMPRRSVPPKPRPPTTRARPRRTSRWSINRCRGWPPTPPI